MSAELATTYAALILADGEAEISAENIQTLVSAAKVESEPIWASLLAKALANTNVSELLTNVGSGAAAPAAGGAAAGGAAAAEEAPKEEKKEEEKEESDDDMVSMFPLARVSQYSSRCVHRASVSSTKRFTPSYSHHPSARSDASAMTPIAFWLHQ